MLIDKWQIEQFRPYLCPPCPSSLLFLDRIQGILDQRVPNCFSIFLPVQRDTGALRFYVRPQIRTVRKANHGRIASCPKPLQQFDYRLFGDALAPIYRRAKCKA